MAKAAGTTPNPFGDDAKEIPQAEWFKPGKKDVGAAIAGRVEAVTSGRVRDGKNWSGHVVLAPAIIVSPRGVGRGFASYNVALNATIKDKITAKMTGEYVGIVYNGDEPSKAGGNPMRVFRAFVITEAKWRELIEKHAPGLTADVAAAAGAADDDDDEGLPF